MCEECDGATTYGAKGAKLCTDEMFNYITTGVLPLDGGTCQSRARSGLQAMARATRAHLFATQEESAASATPR